jgi:hypothetical protein
MGAQLGQASFSVRLITFAALWIFAGAIAASFAEIDVEAGVDLWPIQLAITFFLPFFAAEGIAFRIVPGAYNALLGRTSWEPSVTFVILGVFLLHAIAILSPVGRRYFRILLAIQACLVITGIGCVLYYYHWDAYHMHA